MTFWKHKSSFRRRKLAKGDDKKDGVRTRYDGDDGMLVSLAGLPPERGDGVVAGKE